LVRFYVGWLRCWNADHTFLRHDHLTGAPAGRAAHPTPHRDDYIRPTLAAHTGMIGRQLRGRDDVTFIWQ
jgi:hypothetical protein